MHLSTATFFAEVKASCGYSDLSHEEHVEIGWQQRALHAKTVSSIFSVDECNAIRRAALSAGLNRAIVRRKGGGKKQSRVRTNDFAELPRAEHEWIYDRILERSKAVNDQYWRFAISGIEEAHVLRYRRMQFFKWHFDVGIPRKLTCVFNLSPPEAYWRGGLEIRGRHDGKAAARLQGAGTWFPSYLSHRAKAPWWGERWVLVTWLTGPAWV